MNNDKLKMIKQDLRIAGKDLVTVNIVKPAAFFFSEGYSFVREEGAADKRGRVYINNRAQGAIDCYGITNAGLLMEALVIKRDYKYDEGWEVIAYTACISMCPLNPVGNLKKSKLSDNKFEYGGTL